MYISYLQWVCFCVSVCVCVFMSVQCAYEQCSLNMCTCIMFVVILHLQEKRHYFFHPFDDITQIFGQVFHLQMFQMWCMSVFINDELCLCLIDLCFAHIFFLLALSTFLSCSPSLSITLFLSLSLSIACTNLNLTILRKTIHNQQREKNSNKLSIDHLLFVIWP